MDRAALRLQRSEERKARRKIHRTVGIDQSYGNFAMVLFHDGVPVDRCVFHTGSINTKKNSAKDEELTQSRFFRTSLEQLIYLTDLVLPKIKEWNPSDISLEGLSFGSSGNVERELGALFYGIQASLVRDLGFDRTRLHVVTPIQAKKLAREFLIGNDQYVLDDFGEVVYLKSSKPKLNPMKGKKDVIKALHNTAYGWLVDGYTRDGLVKAKTNPTGLEDLPDAFFIGLYTLEAKYKYHLERPKL